MKQAPEAVTEIFRLNNARLLEERLQVEILSSLENRRARYRNYHQRWKKAVRKNLPKLGVANAAVFRLLHRQFEGPPVPGLPFAVRVARHLASRAKRIRTAVVVKIAGRKMT